MIPRISVIATNRSDNPLVKTTLILAPVALLDQWQLEVEMKTNIGLKCLIYHGAYFALTRLHTYSQNDSRLQ